MKVLALILLLSLPALAGTRAVDLDGTNDRAYGTMPNNATYNALNDYEFIFSLRAPRTSFGTAQALFYFSNVWIYIPASTNQIRVLDWFDSGQSATITLNTSCTRYRVTRVGTTISISSFNTTTGAQCATASEVITTSGAQNFSGSFGLGADYPGQGLNWYLLGKADWFGFKSGLSGLTRMPTDNDLATSSYNLLRFQFEDNFTDDGGSISMTVDGTPAYVTSPLLTPIAVAGADVTQKAAATGSLVGTGSLSDLVAPTCTWTQTLGTAVTIVSPSSCTLATFVAPSPAGGTNEQLTFRLTFTDANGSSTDDIDYGIVVAGATDVLTISDAKIDYWLGRQVMAGSSQIPNGANYENSFNLNAVYWGTAFPAIPPEPTSSGNPIGIQNTSAARIPGTVSVTNNSATVTGSGTLFTQWIEPCSAGALDYFCDNIWIFNGTSYIAYRVLTVTNNTSLTLRTNYAETTNASREFHTQPSASDLITFNRYDLGKILYVLFYRTGLTKWRTLARKVEDSMWQSAGMKYGTELGGAVSPSFNSTLAGAIMRAYDGKPERWDYLFRLGVEKKWNITLLAADTEGEWASRRPANPNILWNDPRDIGWELEWRCMLVKMAIDNYPLYANGTESAQTGTATYGTTERNAQIAEIESAVTGTLIRLQDTDGSFRNDLGCADYFGGCDYIYDKSQPFMDGIALQGLIKAREISANTTFRAAVLTTIKNSLDFLETTYAGALAITNCATIGCVDTTFLRGPPYFAHGGRAPNKNEFDPPYGAYGWPTAPPSLISGDGSIRGLRYTQGFWVLPAYYYYRATGNATYLTRGDDYASSMWGLDNGVRIGHYGTVGVVTQQMKEFSEPYHASPAAMGYRTSGACTVYNWHIPCT